MKRITITAYMLLSTMFGIQAQLSEVYVVTNFNAAIDYFLIFFKNGCYYMELPEQVTHDQIFSIDVSHGNYMLKNNEILLTDVIHGFEMNLLVRRNKTLKVEKGFAFLENRYFGFNGGNYEKDCWIPEMSPSGQQEEREKYNQAQKALFPLRKGIYRSERFGDAQNCYRLNIREENNYSLHYKDILLSEGKWQRDKNVLELCDVHLQHSFYLLIDEKSLVSKYLPGEYQGCSLWYGQEP